MTFGCKILFPSGEERMCAFQFSRKDTLYCKVGEVSVMERHYYG